MDNRNKDKEVDESILDETPPNINEPQTPPEEAGEEEVLDETPQPDAPLDETPTEEVEESQEPSEETEAPQPPVEEPVAEETEDDREKRYKAQQTEAQIQAAKNKALIDKIDSSRNVEPTEDELRAFVSAEGADWDELTPLEQSTQKRLYKAEKSGQLLNEAVQETKNIDKWAGSVDEFLDKTDGDVKYTKLSGHESEFRSFAMKESHRGVDIEGLLLPAFLQQLPPTPKKRGELFPKGGGGEAQTKPGEITDADEASKLRITNPREYKRKLKAGKIKVEI